MADIPAAENPYLSLRGPLGLLLLDDVELLASQLRKALLHADLRAYACGLAGSRDPRGLTLLRAMADDPNPRIRGAVAAALARPWARTDAEPHDPA